MQFVPVKHVNKFDMRRANPKIISFLNWPVLAIGLLLTFTQVKSYGQQSENPYVPTSRPDRINLTVTEDPSTSAAVTWRTHADVGESYAEIARADANPLFVNKAERRKARTETLATKDGSHKDHHWKGDRKSTSLNSSHVAISYAVFC